MKTALIGLIVGVSLITPEGVLARHRHGNVPHHVHNHNMHNPPGWARNRCHYHPKRGIWHCHARPRGHGRNNLSGGPNFGVHFIFPF